VSAILRRTAPAIGAALLALGCGTATVDRADLEQVTADRLGEAVGQQPKSVECPDEIEARAGATGRCTLTAEDGTRYGVTIEMTDDEGGFDARVDDQPLE